MALQEIDAVLVGALSQGQVASPGLIGLAMIWALYQDWRLRKEVAKAESGATAPR